ncbi:MAG: fold metallo-hydrolase [Actinomycetia bacterium]|nr:fold metallo-hydrolase [Actinomycetes bacterium]
MQLDERIHLVGSGSFGFDLSDSHDCHVYLVDGGSELGLIDVGAGIGAAQVIANVRKAGFDPARIQHILCTHGHGDHAGGAAAMRRLLPDASVSVSRQIATFIRNGDEQATSVDVAKVAGIYPPDYRLEPCPVDRELAEGDTIAIGDLRLECIETPGHAAGHLSFVLDHAQERRLFAGDVVFHGGAILLQNIHDCSLEAIITSLRKLRGLAVDALLPGHFAFSLRDGQRHIEKANEALDRLLIPPQVVSAW